MGVNKTAIVLALMAAFLSACSSTEDAGLMNSGQSGVIDASVDGYNTGSNMTATSGYDSSATSGYDSTAPYDPLSQGSTNDDRLNGEALGIDEQNNLSNSANDNAFAASASKNTIYFMYDSSQIQPQFIPVINEQSEYLRANSDQVIILEGHADERGSPEYNIALGEERAKSVAKMMEARGVFRGQLEIVSYGEEKPAASGHDETAWRLNRRVNLIYQRTNK